MRYTQPTVPKRHIFLVIMVILAVVVLSGLLFRFAIGSQVVGTVNGMPIYKEELALFADARRAGVASQFAVKHNLSGMGDGFWTTSYDGEVPADLLLELAFSDAVRDKVIQQESIRHGIVTPADFQEVKKAAEEENQVRRAGGVRVSGTEQYDLAQYYSFQMSRTVEDLMDALMEQELKPTEQQLRQAFDTIAPEVLKKAYRVEGICFSWGDEDAGKDPAAQLVQLLARGIPADELMEALKEAVPSLECDDFSMDSDLVHREDIAGQQLSALLSDAGVGELVTASGVETAYLVEHREGGGLLTIEEAPRFAEAAWINSRYEEYMDELVSKAEVRQQRNARKAVLPG